MQSYIDLSYQPGKSDVVCLFRVEPAVNVSLEKAVDAIAGESSIGTWTDISTMSEEIRDRLRPRAFSVDSSSGLVKIAYPLELFEPGNIPQLLSSVAGNIFGMKHVENLRLEDITLPEKYVKSFPGPLFGVGGIRRMLEIPLRPIVGTIVKPKVGLSPTAWRDAAREALAGGCDFVKDDENLTSQDFCPFDERAKLALGMIHSLEGSTARRFGYGCNISGSVETMVKRAEYIKRNGGRYMMIDVVTVGFAGLQYMRNLNTGLAIHAHRAMHAAITRNKKHGISMIVLAKLCRLAGVDQLHIGTAVGKMEGPAEEVAQIKDEMLDTSGKWRGLKTVFPVCSGGLHQGLIPDLMKLMGNDIIIQAGGGVYGHPDSPKAGAASMRQAVDAVMEGKSIEEYAKSHAELRRALEKFSA
ncbi:MAG: type III ribulose-bisphosphate carboxylase [Candidatus Altiarchaeota archaeon]|nr:type III ribulose-bisphosphate carboxylase [Candidatus Altiarchaeota archaeon]